MKVDNVYFYSDSKTVINYIRTWLYIVRIHEIQNRSEPRQWYYVPSKLKVADVANLQNNCRWFSGPKFLYEVNIEEYLTRNNLNLNVKVDNLISIVKKSSNRRKIKQIINWHYFPNIDKIVRHLA